MSDGNEKETGKVIANLLKSIAHTTSQSPFLCS